MDNDFDLGFGAVFRLLKSLIKDLLYDVVCYSVGWFVLRILTLGRYPSEQLMAGIGDPESTDSIANITGVVILGVIGFKFFW